MSTAKHAEAVARLYAVRTELQGVRAAVEGLGTDIQNEHGPSRRAITFLVRAIDNTTEALTEVKRISL